MFIYVIVGIWGERSKKERIGKYFGQNCKIADQNVVSIKIGDPNVILSLSESLLLSKLSSRYFISQRVLLGR